jgi:hypothetical protein
MAKEMYKPILTTERDIWVVEFGDLVMANVIGRIPRPLKRNLANKLGKEIDSSEVKNYNSSPFKEVFSLFDIKTVTELRVVRGEDSYSNIQGISLDKKSLTTLITCMEISTDLIPIFPFDTDHDEYKPLMENYKDKMKIYLNLVNSQDSKGVIEGFGFYSYSDYLQQNNRFKTVVDLEIEVSKHFKKPKNYESILKGDFLRLN